MPAGGGSLRDVIGLPIDAGPDPAAPRPPIHHLVRGGDGRIDFTAEGQKAVYVVDASGNAEYAFGLTMPAGAQLLDMKASGWRLAVTYMGRSVRVEMDWGLRHGSRSACRCVWTSTRFARLLRAQRIKGPVHTSYGGAGKKPTRDRIAMRTEGDTQQGRAGDSLQRDRRHSETRGSSTRSGEPCAAEATRA